MSRGMKMLKMLNINFPITSEEMEIGDLQASPSNPEDTGSNLLDEALANEFLIALDIDEVETVAVCDSIECSTEKIDYSAAVDHVIAKNAQNEDAYQQNDSNGSDYEPSLEKPEQEEDEEFEFRVLPFEEASNEGNANSESQVVEPIRKRRKRSNIKSDSRYQINKRSRELGLPYNGKKKSEGTWKYNMEKPGKCLANPCKCKLSAGNSVLECRKLNEDQRRSLFDSFWKKSWKEKREYLMGLVKIQPVKRRRGEAEESRRNYTTTYHLQHNFTTYRVCKNMFNNTLGLKHNCALLWIKANMDGNENDSTEKFNQKIKGSTINPRKAECESIRRKLTEFFDSLSKMESHYCRASTQRLYLEPIWQSKQELYRFYSQTYCKEQNVAPTSRTTFNDEFQKMNLSLFRPRKDQCDTCVAYESKNIAEDVYQHHLLLKQEARDAKNQDKMGKISDFVFTMDMQSVLLAPKNQVGAMYYKTKLAVHNFTIYNIKTHEGYCFLWNETEGALTANEFSSIIVSFIQDEILPNMTNKSGRIIFWSDGCCGQNRNACLSNALLNSSITHQVTIIQKYLYKGHTQMEADSMHSAIERRLKNKDINVPADYIIHCQNARQNPFPYKVRYLDHSFFKDFSQVKYFSSIRPGRKVGDPTVNDLKQIKYTPDSLIEYKVRHTDNEWTKLDIRQTTKQITQHNVDTFPALYEERRKIKKEKYDHLQILKKSLPFDYHAFYDEIPFITK